MPDNSQTRSEAASPRRREQARKQGQVATSADLSSGLFLIFMLLLLLYTGPSIGRDIANMLRRDLVGMLVRREWSLDESVNLGWASCLFLLEAVAVTLAGAMVLAVLGNVVQIGFQVAPEALSWKPSRLSPMSGVKKIFSARGVVRTVSGLLKFTACSAAVAGTFYVRHESFLIQSHTLSDVVSDAWVLSCLIMMFGAAAVVAVGAMDFGFQRWQHEEDLKMTKQEVKDETKENEGDPQMKGRIRKLQAESAKLRSLNEVPQATVVITNPTHISVAIRYDRATMAAPRVVAKGKGIMARRIRRRAEEAGVPILERKPIARALFASTEIGAEIPASLYRAVAEILAHVYGSRRAS